MIYPAERTTTQTGAVKFEVGGHPRCFYSHLTPHSVPTRTHSRFPRNDKQEYEQYDRTQKVDRFSKDKKDDESQASRRVYDPLRSAHPPNCSDCVGKQRVDSFEPKSDDMLSLLDTSGGHICSSRTQSGGRSERVRKLGSSLFASVSNVEKKNVY